MFRIFGQGWIGEIGKKDYQNAKKIKKYKPNSKPWIRYFIKKYLENYGFVFKKKFEIFEIQNINDIPSFTISFLLFLAFLVFCFLFHLSKLVQK